MEKYIFVLFAVLLLSINAKSQEKGTFTDSRDNRTYKTVKIGNQTWMAENLAYKSGNSRVYANDENNVTKYGRLYDYNDVSVCPSGWHRPTLADFNSLLANYGGVGKSSYEPLTLTGKSGFSALLAGWHDGNSFMDINGDAYFWSCEFGGRNDAWVLYLNGGSGYTKLYRNSASSSFSMRCIKD